MSSPNAVGAPLRASSAHSSFASLGVPDDLVAVLDRQGIKAPFEIQAAAIPDALSGKDVLGRAPTGSGKTLAFGIPMIAGLGDAKPRRPKGLILSPTRELAEQIRRELEPLARQRKRQVLAIYGGVGFRDQLRGLKAGADLVVACPGRLQDLLNQGEISLNEVQYVFVDEADRMADMGFLPAVRQLLDLTSPNRQTVLFSATLGKEVQILTQNYQVDPVTHEVGEVEPDLSLVDHRFFRTEQRLKVPLAAKVITETGPTVVFCRTRHGVDRVARQLKNAGVKAGWIHGGRSQNQRDAALQAFTNGRVMALVATDVAARGIHVDGVACVIHFDPPEDDKAYVHRSGRTARAGAGGSVVSFINSDQLKDTKKLQRQLALDEDLLDVPEGVAPLAAPSQRNGQQRNGQQKGGEQKSGNRNASRRGGNDRNDSRGNTGNGSRDQARHPQKGSQQSNTARADQGVRQRQEPTRAEPQDRKGGSESSEQEKFNDWTPPKKKSRNRKHRSENGNGGRGGNGKGKAGGPSKRTGKPRPKKKGSSAPKASSHRKGGRPGRSSRPS